MDLKIISIQKSLIDWQDEICNIIFTYGCNWRCKYCYSLDAVLKKPKHFISSNTAINLLCEDQKKFGIDHVEIIGGEPTIYGQTLLKFIDRLKSLDFKIEVSTNGSNPQMIKGFYEHGVDRILIDFKTDFKNYSNLIQRKFNVNDYLESLRNIKKYFKDYQIRTVYLKGYHTKEMLWNIIKTLDLIKIPRDRWKLNPGINFPHIDPNFKFQDSTEEEVNKIQRSIT